MRHPIVIPNLGLVEEVTLVEWTRAAGDQVSTGDIVALIETEKAQVEIESPADGVLAIDIEAGPELIRADVPLGHVEA